MILRRFLMASKVMISISLLLVIPTLDRHFRVETENYKIYFFYGDSLSKPFGQAYYMFESKPAGYELRKSLMEEWKNGSDQQGSIARQDGHMDFSSISSMKARLTQLDKEPFDGFALSVWGIRSNEDVDFLSWDRSALAGLDHLYEFNYPKEFTAISAGFVNVVWGNYLVLKGAGFSGFVRTIIPSDAGLRDSCSGYWFRTITMDMIKEYWSVQGWEYSSTKERWSGREVIIRKTEGNNHTVYDLVIDENYPNGLFTVQISFESENHEMPDDWPAQFKMKKLFF